MEAARAGDFHRGEQLVTAGAELNIADSSGETLLEAIIRRLHPGYPRAGIEQVEMVSLLLNLGADPNFLGQSGPLTLPMLAVDVPMLSVMLAAGADPNLPYGSRDNGTLYDWAAYDYVLEISPIGAALPSSRYQVDCSRDAYTMWHAMAGRT